MVWEPPLLGKPVLVNEMSLAIDRLAIAKLNANFAFLPMVGTHAQGRLLFNFGEQTRLPTLKVVCQKLRCPVGRVAVSKRIIVVRVVTPMKHRHENRRHYFDGFVLEY